MRFHGLPRCSFCGVKISGSLAELSIRISRLPDVISLLEKMPQMIFSGSCVGLWLVWVGKMPYYLSSRHCIMITYLSTTARFLFCSYVGYLVLMSGSGYRCVRCGGKVPPPSPFSSSPTATDPWHALLSGSAPRYTSF